MGQAEIALRRKHAPCRRRRQHLRDFLIHRVLPCVVFLLALAFYIALSLPPEQKRDVPVASVASDGKVRLILPQPDPERIQQSAPKPVAAGTWKLLLVNGDNLLPEDYTIETVTLSSGLQVDERCYPDLQQMMDACREEGLSPMICSAYRTQEFQQTLYENKVQEYLEAGYSLSAAGAAAGKVVAVPGASEHQLGLAVDIVDAGNQNLDESQENTEVQKWLMEHSWEYGFILRYPAGKSDITGIIYEPWHYRYVGREDAAQIHEQGVCLEEYLQGTNQDP